MSIEAQKRQGGRLLIENILAENTAAALTLTANGDYVEISGNYENGDIYIDCIGNTMTLSSSKKNISETFKK